MQPNEHNTDTRDTRSTRPANPAAPWMLIAGVLVGLAGVGYGVNSSTQASRVAESQQANATAVADMQKQVQTLQDRLAAQENRERELTAALASAEQAAAERHAAATAAAPATSASSPAPARRAAAPRAARRPVEDPRIKQFEKRFSEQDEKLASTQRMVENTRSELESRINSTSDELSGSIARTSEEVAALRRRGERDYFEFDIPKSKQLQRVGPVGVALRKSDTKHKRYNLDMMVDDNKLEKKNVNLFEPVYITSPEWHQPLELVVNRVDKNRVTGYISVPKHKRSELASSSAETTRNKLAPPSSPTPNED